MINPLRRRHAARTAKFRMCAADAPDVPASTEASTSNASSPESSTSAREAWEVALDPPPLPKDPIDRRLGEETAVVSVDESVPISLDTWLQSALDARSSDEEVVMPGLRAKAEQVLPNLQVPNRRIESWRFTDLRSLYASRYVRAEVDRDAVGGFDVRKYVPDTAGFVLVFVDGVYDEELSMVTDDSASELKEKGGYFGSVKGYDGDLEEVEEILTGRELGSEGEEALFPMAAHAIGEDVAVLKVPRNYAVARPVAVLFVSTTGEAVNRARINSARLAVVAGEGSRLVLLESYVSLDEDASYTTTLAATGVRVKDDANVKHYIVNDCCLEAHLMASVHAEVCSGGTYELRSVGIGGQVGRFTVGVDLNGSGSHGLVHGALIANEHQVADIHSRICHNAKGTTSNQLQKNIAADHGRTIFRGKVVVTEQGEHTNADQLCRSLLLSDKATVDAMPVLEIANDEVQCTHGATVSDLEDDQLFYCQSRGLTQQDAQYLILAGFALDVLGDCPFPSLAEEVARKVDKLAITSAARERVGGQYTSI